MADDDAGWMTEDIEEEVPVEAAPEAAAEGGEAKPAEGEAPAEELPPPPAQDSGKPVYRKHWIRPTFLNYKYIHDYRQVYYDDVIDYLDKRQRGLIREVPRAQEWPERAMRMSINKFGRTESLRARDKDIHLLSNISTGAKFYRYHSNAFVHQKYGKYLYS